MKRRLDRNLDAMTVRQRTVEHLFGTLKHWMGSTHFLMRRLKNVSTDELAGAGLQHEARDPDPGHGCDYEGDEGGGHLRNRAVSSPRRPALLAVRDRRDSLRYLLRFHTASAAIGRSTPRPKLLVASDSKKHCSTFGFTLEVREHTMQPFFMIGFTGKDHRRTVTALQRPHNAAIDSADHLPLLAQLERRLWLATSPSPETPARLLPPKTTEPLTKIALHPACAYQSRSHGQHYSCRLP